MAKYLVQGSYTAEGFKALQKDKASGRKQVIQKAIESLDGRLESFYFSLGKHDVVLIVDMPDLVSLTALGIAVSASGLARSTTTALITVEETDKALAKKPNYRATGG